MKTAVFIAATLLAAGAARGGEESTVEMQLPARENFHLFLLAGQSNMAGRGCPSGKRACAA